MKFQILLIPTLLFFSGCATTNWAQIDKRQIDKIIENQINKKEEVQPTIEEKELLKELSAIQKKLNITRQKFQIKKAMSIAEGGIAHPPYIPMEEMNQDPEIKRLNDLWKEKRKPIKAYFDRKSQVRKNTYEQKEKLFKKYMREFSDKYNYDLIMKNVEGYASDDIYFNRSGKRINVTGKMIEFIESQQ